MFIWTNDLNTGNTMIDNQHKELIKAINDLINACSQGKGRIKIKETLDFLNNYVYRHFGDEEVLQLKYKYPDYTNHKKLHDGYKQVVKDIIAEYESNGSSVALVSKINTSIGGWLINHIKKEDVRVATHIKNAKL